MNEIDTLSARQEKILIQLDLFKTQLQEIRSGLQICVKSEKMNTKFLGELDLKLIDVSSELYFLGYLMN